MSKKKAYRKPTHRPLLTDHEKVWAFCVAIRDESVFKEASVLVKDEHFSDNEMALALVWRVVRQFHKEAAELPSERIIVTRCNSELKLNPDCLAAGDEQKVNDLLSTAFGLLEEDINPRVALETIRKFLEDRLVFKSQELLSVPQTPVVLADTLARLQAEAEQVASLGCSTVLPDDLDVICHPPSRDGRCHVVACFGTLTHEHLFNPLDQFQRELFCEKALLGLKLPPHAQNELEKRVLVEARGGTISIG